MIELVLIVCLMGAPECIRSSKEMPRWDVCTDLLPAARRILAEDFPFPVYSASAECHYTPPGEDS